MMELIVLSSGTLLVGQLAEYFGPQMALRWMCGLGLSVLLFLWWRYPVLQDQERRATGAEAHQ